MKKLAFLLMLASFQAFAYSPNSGVSDTNPSPVYQRNYAATYHYRAADVTPVATATDVLVLKGSATKTVRVTKVTISGTATANAIYDVYLTKRTTADTGGTSTNPTPTPSDSSDAAASATLYLYTANPSALGTGSALEGDKVFLTNGTTPTVAPGRIEYIWGNRGDKQPILRGVAESLAVNFNGQAVPAGASLYLTIEWIEE